MKARIAAVVAAIVLGVAVPASSAMAFTYGAPIERVAPASPYQIQGRSTLGAHDGPMFTACPQSSAAEGNARQQNFPVKQYGQTSGGPLC
ncbi:hypothetical protein [Methylobacterium haplocladii]|uniref:Uncharacterized protein n=1 Tax=Methylobacterium haplocladii TaxID=1176176 RepID=A0A512IJT8_9HYPH|nr:hypothetical protein [Methylobacterium haplocladii]GEO97959.1 hypothetical protein MHA02_03470 [Methylobacterium haplocladii]GJD86011.1 hypothetical protein HPGCJGGD_3906 [Methylobacterium haplocladii]GLS61008.1 hypothetical protein GCM10007887_37010 [Methylobacterium haplocladii]